MCLCMGICTHECVSYEWNDTMCFEDQVTWSLRGIKSILRCLLSLHQTSGFHTWETGISHPKCSNL